MKKQHNKITNMPITVYVHDNNVEKALGLFKRKIKEAKLLYTIYENSYYTKPSDKKRAKRNKAKLKYKYINRHSY